MVRVAGGQSPLLKMITALLNAPNSFIQLIQWEIIIASPRPALINFAQSGLLVQEPAIAAAFATLITVAFSFRQLLIDIIIVKELH